MSIRNSIEVSDLTRFANACGVAITSDMALFQDRFRPNLQHFAEYGLLLSPHRLALVTLGCGHAFGASVVRFLRDTGHRQIAVSQMDELQAALGSWMLVRCAYDRGGRSTTSLYFRQPLSLVSIGAFLKDYEVPECDLEGLKNLAGLLGTEHTGIVSVQFRRDAIPWFRVYLSAKAEAEVSLASKLRTAFGAFPTLDSSWNRFRSHVGEVYRGGTVRISIRVEGFFTLEIYFVRLLFLHLLIIEFWVN